YPSMVHLAQNFKMRYPLVDGQGNYGSIDGDPPAQMRYTEARMQKITEEMLKDLDKQTVNFRDNYDATRKEPSVLPARFPQLITNGSIGIAVGMATNIPPHNLSEVIDAITHLIDHPDADTEDLLNFIKGPDFPTGGQIYDIEALKNAYATGRGSIVVRGKTEIVEGKKGAFKIIVSEIPYQANKATIIEKVATLVKDKKILGIKDIRDESGREEDIRIVIELKKDAYPKKVLNRLYKLTDLQTAFHFNMLALIDGIQPRVLNLKSLLEQYISHRVIVVTRRTKFELKQAKDRAHILQGLKKALDHIDAVIKTIKASKTKEIAHNNLIKKFKLTAKQSTAILEMKLQTLAGLEQKKIADELKMKLALIKELEEILKSKKKILQIIKKEILELKEKFGDGRKTKIFKHKAGTFAEEDLVPNEEIIISMTKGGYIKRMVTQTYKTQRRGGKGVQGMKMKEEDIIERLFWTMSHSNILFFTNKGRVFQTKAYEIPEATRQAKGQAIVNFLQLSSEEKVTGVIYLDKEKRDVRFLAMTTMKGLTKKVDIGGFENVRRSGLIAIKLKKDDELRWVEATTGNNEIMIVTAKGQAIRFKEKDIRPMGRNAFGVRGIRLKGDDKVIGMDVLKKEKSLQVLTISENGYGKRSDLKSYKIQRRGGSGIKTTKITAKTGKLVSMKILSGEEQKYDILVISANGQVIRTHIKDISILGRATQGVRIMRLDSGDKIASVTVI
ncbi:MAG: hypothetical protein ACD_63C00028G0004, partial [uncultured bacterium]